LTPVLSILFSIVLQGRAFAVTGGNARTLRQAGSSFISSLKFNHKLRVCNAYPYARPIDVYLGKTSLTTTDPIKYKACREFAQALKEGDKIDFKVGDSFAGSFSVSDLPENDAVLALIIYRHDTMSTAVSFESHVFSNLLNAQVAVIDAYRGSAKSLLHIRDHSAGGTGKLARTEELRYDSVVAVNQGAYEVVLKTTEGKTADESPLVALTRESYLVIRCGVESMQGKSYPEGVMVYPQSDPGQLGGAATLRPVFMVTLLMLTMQLFAA